MKIKINKPEATKQELIDQLLDGKLNKFLKHHRSQYRFEMVYSRTFPEWQEEHNSRRAVKWLKRTARWPKHIVEVVNIAITLNKKYGLEITRPNVELCYKLWDHISHEEMYDYMKLDWHKRVKAGKLGIVPAKKAFKEQKARGYIHVNDWEDFDRICSHSYSNVDRDYIYPENFTHGAKTRGRGDISIHIGNSLVGVSGHTRSVYGITRKK